MPTTIIFPRCYSFGTVDPRTLTTYQNLAVNQTVTTLTDDEDGTPDGIIALNATMSWSAASDAQLVGVTDAGYPVIEDTGFFYILTNQDNLDLGSRHAQLRRTDRDPYPKLPTHISGNACRPIHV